MPENISDQERSSAIELARNVNEIYESFEQAVLELGAKKKGKKIAGSVMHWIGGSHVKTERDILCDKFLADMQSYLELFDSALEGEDREIVQEACGILVDECSQPVPADSNGTISLMKRAMLGQVKGYLPKLSKEKLAEVKDRIEKAYAKWQRLPVEKEVLREIDKLI